MMAIQQGHEQRKPWLKGATKKPISLTEVHFNKTFETGVCGKRYIDSHWFQFVRKASFPTALGSITGEMLVGS